MLFREFAEVTAAGAGNARTFIIATVSIMLWLITGPLFHFSNGWQLVMNTITSIITFLMVFLIQNTQNRDTTIINLKLDELIFSHKEANNFAIDLHKLSDAELKQLEEEYKKICHKRKPAKH